MYCLILIAIIALFYGDTKSLPYKVIENKRFPRADGQDTVGSLLFNYCVFELRNSDDETCLSQDIRLLLQETSSASGSLMKQISRMAA
jgi:hypothetical protein